MEDRDWLSICSLERDDWFSLARWLLLICTHIHAMMSRFCPLCQCWLVACQAYSRTLLEQQHATLKTRKNQWRGFISAFCSSECVQLLIIRIPLLLYGLLFLCSVTVCILISVWLNVLKACMLHWVTWIAWLLHQWFYIYNHRSVHTVKRKNTAMALLSHFNVILQWSQCIACQHLPK